MSRSSRPLSSIAERPEENDGSASPSSSDSRTPRRKLSLRFAAWMRWLHIYLSMFGLAAVLFFGVTGLTLNHPDWFFANAERRVEAEGQVKQEWLHSKTPGSSAASADDAKDDLEVAKLEIVEHLRSTHGIRGALAEFRTDDRECMVTFKGPGYAADAFIDRESGKYNVAQTYHGFVAIVNDLHKGRDTGPVWSALIDVSAVLVTLISLTGLVLLFYLKLRRVPGLVVALIGIVVMALVFGFGVP